MLKPTYDLTYSSNYPSEWMYGNLAGSIHFIRNKLSLKSPYIYKLIDYTNDNLQEKVNELYKLNLQSAPAEKIKNRIRFISDSLAEVELSLNQIGTIDRINLPKIFEYDLSVKQKKTRNGSIYYPMYCEKKIHHPLYKLFMDADLITYKDGNPLNLTIENLLDPNKKFDIKQNKPIIKLSNNNNPWLGGKYAGTIFCRTNSLAWNMLLKTEEKNYTKYIKFDESNKQEKYDELNNLRMKLSDDLGLTRNKYRYIDDDTIEVKLDKDQTFITDSKFIDIVEKYTLCVKKGGLENSKYYVGLISGNKVLNFHNHITGFNFVDHIDRNPMNNKLDNLRDADSNINNKNKTVGPKIYDPNYLCGIRIIDNCYNVRFKTNNVQFSKYFSINKYGDDQAKKMAIRWRLDMLKKHNSKNFHENDIITLYDLPKLDPFFYQLDDYQNKILSKLHNKVELII